MATTDDVAPEQTERRALRAPTPGWTRALAWMTTVAATDAARTCELDDQATADPRVAWLVLILALLVLIQRFHWRAAFQALCFGPEAHPETTTRAVQTEPRQLRDVGTNGLAKYTMHSAHPRYLAYENGFREAGVVEVSNPYAETSLHGLAQ